MVLKTSLPIVPTKVKALSPCVFAFDAVCGLRFAKPAAEIAARLLEQESQDSDDAEVLTGVWRKAEDSDDAEVPTKAKDSDDAEVPTKAKDSDDAEDCRYEAAAATGSNDEPDATGRRGLVVFQIRLGSKRKAEDSDDAVDPRKPKIPMMPKNPMMPKIPMMPKNVTVKNDLLEAPMYPVDTLLGNCQPLESCSACPLMISDMCACLFACVCEYHSLSHDGT